MRRITFILAVCGLLSVITTFAVAQERSVNVTTSPVLTTVADQVAVTPVRWYVYKPASGWYGYYRYPPYYTYRPRYYWYGPPRYYDYYADPYPGYYYPNGFGLEYYGPRRSYYFGF
jgi:hypothetical protein